MLFRQGDVHEHTELCWLLSSVTSVGQLNRMHQFRDKAGAARDRVSAGLLFYPVLMAADVLAYRANEVPVGEDQREHIELMRDVAERSTSASARRSSCPRATSRRSAPACATSRSPSKKMSTTGGTPAGTVYVDEEPESIVKKFKRRVADSGRRSSCADDKPGISNMIEILAVVRDVTPGRHRARLRGLGLRRLQDRGRRGGRRVAGPVREKYLELREDTAAIESFLETGAEKARAIASAVVADVREAHGRRARPHRPPSLPGVRSRSSSWTWTSSRVPSTCSSR